MAELYINGTIVDDEDMAGGGACPSAIRAELAAIDAEAPLDIHINSGGGSVVAGVAIANMIARHKGETRAFNDGLVGSIAGQIYFSADECFAPSNTFFLIHNPTTDAQGNAAEMRKAADNLDEIQRGLETTYVKKAREGVSEEQIHKMMTEETWLSATEAAKVFVLTVIDALTTVNALGVENLRAQGIKIPAALNVWNEKSIAKINAALTNAEKIIGHKEERKETEMTNEINSELRVRAFNKLLVNSVRTVPLPLSDSEKKAYYNGDPGSPGLIESIPSRGGYLVPPEKQRQLIEYRQLYTALKDIVHTIPVTSSHGEFPRLPQQALEYSTFDELTPIQETGMQFERLSFTTVDRGLILPISNQMLEDSDFDVIDLCGRELARAAVATENKEIIAKLQPKIDSATLISDWRGLNAALFKDLDAAYAQNAEILTNQIGFWWLASLEDDDGRPLLVADLASPNKYTFRGVPIIVVADAVLPNKVSNAYSYAPFVCGDFFTAVLFFERRGFSLSLSTEHLWHMDASALRSVLRFDVVIADDNALKAVAVKI